MSGQQGFAFVAAAGTPNMGNSFQQVFNHGGLELWAKCTATGFLQLRARNGSTNNAAIKLYTSNPNTSITSTGGTPSPANGSADTTAYAGTPPGQSANHARYTENDEFTASTLWDFDPMATTGGISDTEGTLSYVDSAGSVVGITFLAHQTTENTGGAPNVEPPFASTSTIACVFAGQGLYPPGT